jgi:hypothetical protein
VCDICSSEAGNGARWPAPLCQPVIITHKQTPNRAQETRNGLQRQRLLQACLGVAKSAAIRQLSDSDADAPRPRPRTPAADAPTVTPTADRRCRMPAPTCRCRPPGRPRAPGRTGRAQRTDPRDAHIQVRAGLKEPASRAPAARL